MYKLFQIICFIFYIASVLSMFTGFSNGTALNVYVTNRNYTWKEAKKVCKMIKPEDKYILSDKDRLFWIDATATYSPWAEYIGPFELNAKQIVKRRTIGSGLQLLQCLNICSEYTFIGLKHRICYCLRETPLNAKTVSKTLSQMSTEICRGDDETFCGMDYTNDTNDNTLTLYKRAQFSIPTGDEDCLSIMEPDKGDKYLQLIECTAKLYQLCLDGRNTDKFFPKLVSQSNWTSAFSQCERGAMPTYDIIKSKTVPFKGQYWLPYKRQSNMSPQSLINPEHCIAVQIRRENSKIIQHIKRCETLLPALCIQNQKSFSERPSSLSVILGIIASILVLTIITVIIISLRRRKRRKPSQIAPVNHCRAPDEKQVGYAQVIKPLTTSQQYDGGCDKAERKLEFDNSYDHICHHKKEIHVGDKIVGNESPYDTVHTIQLEEENNYDATININTGTKFKANNEEYSEVEIKCQIVCS